MIRQKIFVVIGTILLVTMVSCKPKPNTTTMIVSPLGLESHPIQKGDVLQWVATDPSVSSFKIHLHGIDICKGQQGYDIPSVRKDPKSLPVATCEILNIPPSTGGVGTHWYDLNVTVCADADGNPVPCKSTEEKHLFEHTNPCGGCSGVSDGFDSSMDFDKTSNSTPSDSGAAPSPTSREALPPKAGPQAAGGSGSKLTSLGHNVYCENGKLVGPEDPIYIPTAQSSINWYGDTDQSVSVVFKNSSPCKTNPLPPSVNGRVSCVIDADPPPGSTYPYTLSIRPANSQTPACSSGDGALSLKK